MADELLEKLSALEHEQWMSWTMQMMVKLEDILGKEHAACQLFKSHWEKNWKVYNGLTEASKEFDRIWARRVLKIING